MKLFSGRYEGRRVLITGHTGFKGSWLALWLNELGAKVVGLALPPKGTPNHWDLLRLGAPEHRQDIRDAEALTRALHDIRPEIVFHLAAQSLVRRSYHSPLETWHTNAIGTANLLEACRHTHGVSAIVVVTSDKCYENLEQGRPYREGDRLGGHDPYSASKAGAELVTASYRDSFFREPGSPLVATARAGNVIGGGDWSEDRLIPDLVRAHAAQAPLEIRSPRSTRPWQHVLESLSGYLLLGEMLLEGRPSVASAWNFGPEPEGNQTVAAVLDRLREHWPDLTWRHAHGPQPHEAGLLSLDISRARTELGWRPVWNLGEALGATARWYRSFYGTGRVSSREQLGEYVHAARAGGAAWAAP